MDYVCVNLYILLFQNNTKKNKFVRDLVREVCGFAPYEKRTVELLKVSKDKRALKFLKKKVNWLKLIWKTLFKIKLYIL